MGGDGREKTANDFYDSLYEAFLGYDTLYI